MEEDTPQPLFRNNMLIALGSIAIALLTVYGLLNNPGEVIREDVRLGPVIAASRIVIPLFLTIGLLVLLAKVKKCKVCGKIFIWRRPTLD